jgi:hypothetical protein
MLGTFPLGKPLRWTKAGHELNNRILEAGATLRICRVSSTQLRFGLERARSFLSEWLL